MTTRPYRALGIVRLALSMFPAPFRDRYGRDLLQCISDARRDLSSESLAGPIRFWILIAADLTRSAFLERCRSVARETWSLALRRTGGALLIAAALANVVYDAVSIKLSMGVFAALLTAISAVTGTLLIRGGQRKAR
jgi:hypothetical protein